MTDLNESTRYLFSEIVDRIEDESSPIVRAKLATFLAYREVELDEGYEADREVMGILDRYEIPYEDLGDGTREYAVVGA